MVKKYIDTVLGKEKFDIIIVNGQFVNVFTDEILSNWIVGIKDDKIVYCGEYDNKIINNSKKVIDAENKYICAGFIEAHTHIGQIFRLCDFSKVSLLSGVTTVITECGEFGNTTGKDGIKEFIKDCESQHINLYVVLPPLTPPFPEFETSKGLELRDYLELLNHPRVLGLGEFYWTRILKMNDLYERIIDYTLSIGKTVHGHSAGAKKTKLNAYISMGIKSCHEPITIDEIIERVRLGIHVVLREGSVRCDFSNIYKFKDRLKDLRMISISTDGVTPQWLIEKGTLNEVARRAVKYGFTPIETIKMLSLNASYVFNLQDKVGSLSPGKNADIVIFDDLENFNVDTVIVNGEIKILKKKFLCNFMPYNYPKFYKNTIILKDFTKEDFLYKSEKDKVIVKAIKYLDFLLTGMEEVELKVVEKNIKADVSKNVLKFCKIDVYGSNRIIKGFIKDLGLKSITYCSNINWEAYQLTVIGPNEEDMAIAVNRLKNLQGGVVIVKNGKILEEIPMPISGIMSELSLEELAEREKKINQILIEDGIRMKNPLLWMQTLSFTGLPYYKLTDKGLVDIRNQKILDIFH